MNNEAFKAFHDQYLQAWKKTMESGNTTAVEKMASDYYVIFFTESRKPTFFDRSEAIEGLRGSVNNSLGRFTKEFENRVIRMKAADHASVFYEQVLMENDQEKARLFTIENWNNIDGEWLLTREVEEKI